jgi:hypothetical protein
MASLQDFSMTIGGLSDKRYVKLSPIFFFFNQVDLMKVLILYTSH